MPSIADIALTESAVPNIQVMHGEMLTVVSGAEAGKPFVGVVEIEDDLGLETELGNDPRAKRMVRFPKASAPVLSSQDIVQTEDGKRWNAIRRPDGAYLSVDYELKEIVNGKDT